MQIRMAGCVFWGIVVSLATLHAETGGDRRLIDAVKKQDAAAVRALLEKRVDVNVRQGDGATALHWAAHRDDVDMTALLVRAGANVNAADDLGVTPLSLACANGSSALVERLLKAGANPNVVMASGESPLMSAARTGRKAKQALASSVRPSRASIWSSWARSA